MKINRRNLLKKLSAYVSGFYFLGFSSSVFGKGKKFKLQPHSKEILDEVYFLPSDPDYYELVSNIYFGNIASGKLPKISAENACIMGKEQYYNAKVGESYTAQYLGPTLGWFIS